MGIGRTFESVLAGRNAVAVAVTLSVVAAGPLRAQTSRLTAVPATTMRAASLPASSASVTDEEIKGWIAQLVSSDPKEQSEARSRFQSAGAARVRGLLIEALSDKDSRIRIAAAEILVKLEGDRVAPQLVKLIGDPVISVRAWALMKIWGTCYTKGVQDTLATPEGAAALRAATKDSDQQVRRSAVHIAMVITTTPDGELLASCLSSDDKTIRQSALQALERTGRPSKEHFNAVLRLVDDPETASMAAEVLGNMGDERAAGAITALLKESHEASGTAAAALVKLKGREAVKPILEAIKGGRSQRSALAAELARLGRRRRRRCWWRT